MPRLARVVSSLFAAIAVIAFICSFWFPEYFWKLVGSGFVLLISAIVILALSTPEGKKP